MKNTRPTLIVFLKLSLVDAAFRGTGIVGTSNFINFILLECVSSTIKSTLGNNLKSHRYGK